MRTMTPGEADVTINGKPLSLGQVMALRVAVTAYHAMMHGELGQMLGDDELRDAYRKRLGEVVQLLIEDKPS